MANYVDTAVMLTLRHFTLQPADPQGSAMIIGFGLCR